MSRRLALILAAFTCTASLTSQEIKLGSLAPAASPFEETLRAMAAEWSSISNGRIVVRIYSGGVVGDEPDMVRKLRLGQLGAAALTSAGLSRIYSGALAVSAPLLIRDDQEMAYVFNRLQPFLDQQMHERGYTVLLWRHAGWLHFFSRRPVTHPDDLRSQRLWVWDADPVEVRGWQSARFTVTSLAATEVMISLQNGLLDAFATSPLSAASFQWFGIAQHMSDLRWAPLMGAIIVSNRVWDRLPADMRPRLREAAARAARFMGDPSAADSEAVAVMQRYGLQVHAISPSDRAAWQTIVDNQFAALIGPVIDPEAYALTKRYVEEYRSSP